MTDPNISDKVRKLAARFRQQMEPHTPAGECAVWACAAEAVETLLSPPPLPTLADMTPTARRECQWMQCEVRGERRIITLVYDDGDLKHAMTLTPSGYFHHCYLESVTPRPDLPRLEWPGDKNPAPAPALPDGWRFADHPDNGRVIVTTAPDRYGRVYYVLPASESGMGFDWLFCDHSELKYLDGDQ